MTHYQTLGVSPDSKYDTIRSAYRSLVIRHHPDKGGDPLIFKAVQQAYETLGDETKRRAYDSAVKKKPVASLTESAARIVDEFIAAC